MANGWVSRASRKITLHLRSGLRFGGRRTFLTCFVKYSAEFTRFFSFLIGPVSVFGDVERP